MAISFNVCMGHPLGEAGRFENLRRSVQNWYAPFLCHKTNKIFLNYQVMDNLNSEENNISNEDVTPKKEGKKRVSYVFRDHLSMVEFVSGMYRNLGHTDYHSNKAIAAAHQLSPDSIKQQLTCCQQYRLLEIKHGVGYKITELFLRIFLPVNDSEKRVAVIESLKSPDTYQQLFKEYEYHIVPPLSGLKNHFVRNFNFAPAIAEKAAQVFIENLKEYDLLDPRGVLTSAMPAKPKEPEVIKDKPPVTPVIPGVVPPAYTPPPPDDGLFELPIPLPNRRKAYLRYPLENLTRKDINVITKALEFIASSLEDELT